MDTSAYLSKQGWLGAGHSLHPTGRGITKPLLISQKTNVLGIGKKKHDAHADRWWARAFDSSLRSLEVGKNRITGDTGNVTAGGFGALDMGKAGGARWTGNGGLYAGFVKGATLGGTLALEMVRVEDGLNEAGNDEETKVDDVTAHGVRTEKRRRKEERSERIAKEERRERKRSKTTTTADQSTMTDDRSIMTDPDSRLTKEHRRQARTERRVTREKRSLTKLSMKQTTATTV